MQSIRRFWPIRIQWTWPGQNASPDMESREQALRDRIKELETELAGMNVQPIDSLTNALIGARTGTWICTETYGNALLTRRITISSSKVGVTLHVWETDNSVVEDWGKRHSSGWERGWTPWTSNRARMDWLCLQERKCKVGLSIRIGFI